MGNTLDKLRGDVQMESNNEISLEKRIIEPCLEFIEKMQRSKDRAQKYDKYIEQKRVELEKSIRGGINTSKSNSYCRNEMYLAV